MSVIIFSCNSAYSDVEINSANFPDDNFRSYIINELGADSNNDGVLSSSEIALIESIDVTKREIKDLSGIEYFSALGELYCYANNLTRLDVSKNSALYLLECDNNKIAKLDISKNSELINLECELNSLTELNLGSNDNLGYVKCYSQTCDGLEAVSDDKGGYIVDMKKYVDNANLDKIINLRVHYQSRDVISIDREAKFDSASGLVHSSTYPVRLRYSYKINYKLDPELSMDVVINGVIMNNKSTSSYSVSRGSSGCNSEYGIVSALAVMIMFAFRARIRKHK